MKYNKGTFVIVPNINELALLPPTAQGLYLWICKFSDENGSCYPSRKKLASLLNCDMRTIDKYMQILVDNELIEKTKRKKEGTNENMSNLYQLLICSDPSSRLDVTPSEQNVPVTVSSINSIQLTNSETEVSSVQTLRTDGKLPESRGNTYIKRVLSVYSDLFKNTYNCAPVVDFGRFGKSLKSLMLTHTELQVSALMIVFFNWHGVTGSDDLAHKKLLEATFNPQWFFSSIQTYEVYIRNIQCLEFDNEVAVRGFVARELIALKH